MEPINSGEQWIWMMTMAPIRHLLSLHGCSGNLAYSCQLEDTLRFVESDFEKKYLHQFTPQGVTFAYLSPGKHLTGHTWPENAAVEIDYFNEDKYQANMICEQIIMALKPKDIFIGKEYKIPKNPVGKQICATLYGVEDLNNVSLQDLIGEVAQEAKYSVVGKIQAHTDEIKSALLILSESHFATHYFKEKNKLWVDIFTCGNEGCSKTGLNILQKKIKHEKCMDSYFLR
jgi:S-adenosylmethionine/arginine decarboxylase-like enzyme